MKFPNTLVFMMIVFCGFQSFSQPSLERIYYEGQEEQRIMVGQLTGHLPIKGKRKIDNRGTAVTRKLSSEFLYDKLNESEIRAYKQEYNVEDDKGREYAGNNIYGIVPATNGSKEYLILCANYDTAKDSPGAIHNATGVSLIHAVAKRLKGLQHRTKNVMIVFFDQQQKKMVGCRMFVNFLKEKRYKIHSMHRIDYIGWDRDHDKAIEILSSNISLETSYRLAAFDPVFKRFVSSPEASLFSKFGYETITITSELKNGDSSPFVNLVSDTYGTVDFDYLFSTTNLVFRAFQGILGIEEINARGSVTGF